MRLSSGGIELAPFFLPEPNKALGNSNIFLRQLFAHVDFPRKNGQQVIPETRMMTSTIIIHFNIIKKSISMGLRLRLQIDK